MIEKLPDMSDWSQSAGNRELADKINEIIDCLNELQKTTPNQHGWWKVGEKLDEQR